MRKIYAVIGSGYGDEGKGLFTDYLSSLGQSSVVIRYNGGAQAGHTVVSPEGKRHVFGHFGANSFLKNSKTVLSRFFVVNPLLFKKEFFTLNSLGLSPIVYCHAKAYVSTPFDMIINQLMERKRGTSRHGSCGLGFGQTIEREEKRGVGFVFEDLFLPKLEMMAKLFKVRQYFIEEVKYLALTDLLGKEELNSMLSKSFLEKFYQDCVDVSVMIKKCDDELSEEDLADISKQIVFEGAQGLMLDQFYGVFPHVTRSNTGLKNIVEIINGKNVELNAFYATRCYVTRHGAGPLPGELDQKPYPSIVDETNIDNLYQGSLRFAYLNIDVLRNAIQHDMKYWSQSNNQLNVALAVSCLDQTDVVKFFSSGILHEMESKNFKQMLFNEFDFTEKMMESYSPTREKIKTNDRF